MLDVSRFRVGDWILVVAGAMMLILALAVPWVTVSLRGRDFPGARNAFNYPLTGGTAWLLVVGAGVIAFLRAARLMREGKVPWTRLTLVATALAVVLLGVRLGFGAGDDEQADLGRGAGMVIALVSALLALGGAVANHRAEGGTWQQVWSRRTPAPRPPPPPPF